MKNVAIILAAGNSTRCNFSNNIPKQYQKINDKELLSLVIENFLFLDDIILVINPDHQKYYNKIVKKHDLNHVIYGGNTRQESVLNALQYCQILQPDNVMIHDGARVFVSDNIIKKSIELLSKHQAIAPILPVSDTIREISGQQVRVINRDNLYKVQTPQSFSYKLLYDCYKNASDISYTDDASLIEACNKKVEFFVGEELNFKITTQDDFIMAQKIANDFSLNKVNKVAIGYDIHGFILDDNLVEQGNYIMVGGIKIPCKYKIKAHSDGDVLIHALVDAMLGVMAAGDIGDHFSDKDPQYANADSLLFLAKIYKLLQKNNLNIINIDINIIAEIPKISPYKLEIREKLANFLKLDINQISLKATTSEKLGFIGRKEGIAAQVIINVI